MCGISADIKILDILFLYFFLELFSVTFYCFMHGPFAFKNLCRESWKRPKGILSFTALVTGALTTTHHQQINILHSHAEQRGYTVGKNYLS